MLSLKARLRRETRDFLCNIQLPHPHAITLSHKMVYHGPSGPVRNNPDYCRKNLRYFFHMRAQEVGLTTGDEIRRIAVLETDASGRFHYHLIVALPTFRLRMNIVGNLWLTWPQTHWGYDTFHAEPITDLPGYILYITKREYGGAECGIDWFNTRL